MKLNVLNQFPEAILHVGLPHIPFLQQDDFHGVFATLGDGYFLIFFNDIAILL